MKRPLYPKRVHVLFLFPFHGIERRDPVHYRNFPLVDGFERISSENVILVLLMMFLFHAHHDHYHHVRIGCCCCYLILWDQSQINEGKIVLFSMRVKIQIYYLHNDDVHQIYDRSRQARLHHDVLVLLVVV